MLGQMGWVRKEGSRPTLGCWTLIIRGQACCSKAYKEDGRNSGIPRECPQMADPMAQGGAAGFLIARIHRGPKHSGGKVLVT